MTDRVSAPTASRLRLAQFLGGLSLVRYEYPRCVGVQSLASGMIARAAASGKRIGDTISNSFCEVGASSARRLGQAVTVQDSLFPLEKGGSRGTEGASTRNPGRSSSCDSPRARDTSLVVLRLAVGLGSASHFVVRSSGGTRRRARIRVAFRRSLVRCAFVNGRRPSFVTCSTRCSPSAVDSSSAHWRSAGASRTRRALTA